MPLAHACHICGHSLTAVPARWDLVPPLPVVVCPGCGAACVRRRHPLSLAWRDARAWARTLLALGTTAAAAGLLAALTLGLSGLMARQARHHDLRALARHAAGVADDAEAYQRWVDDGGPAALALFGGAWVLAGVALTAGLPHARRRVVWGGFALLLGLALAGAGVDDWLSRAEAARASTQGRVSVVNFDRASYEGVARAAGAGLAVSLLGVPFGLRLRAAGRARRVRGWGRLRARVRRRRIAA